MQKIKKFSWDLRGKVYQTSSVIFSSNDNETTFIEITTNEEYNGLDSVLLVQKKDEIGARLYSARVSEGKSSFELDEASMDKAVYTLHYRVYDGTKMVESPSFSFEITEGAVFTELELSPEQIYTIEDAIRDMLEAIRASEVAKDNLVQATADSKKELEDYKVVLEGQLNDRAESHIRTVGAVGAQQIEAIHNASGAEVAKVTAEGTKQIGLMTAEMNGQIERIEAQGSTSIGAVVAQETSSRNAVISTGDTKKAEISELTEAKKNELYSYTEQKKTEINTLATNEKNLIVSTADTKKAEVIKAGSDSIGAINELSTQVVSGIESAGNSKVSEIVNEGNVQISRIEPELEKQIAEHQLTARQEDLEQRQEDVEWRMGRLEVFRMNDTPSRKLSTVTGVEDGRFGYWDLRKLTPENIEKAINWEDNGVFSDLPKQ